MAKTTYIDLEAGLEQAYYKAVQSGSRFISSRVVRKTSFLSRSRIKGLTAKSMLPSIASAWAGFDVDQRSAWADAGFISSLNGWRMFVKDQSLRIKNALSGTATPSLFHQAKVGNLHIEAPATELEIVQLHPIEYWVSRPVAGKKGMREPVLITEGFALPLDISLSYSSDLTSLGAGSYARFIARVWSSYQGVDRFTDLFFDMALSHDWETLTNELTTVIGHVIGYTLIIKLYNVRGNLYIDNVQANHSGQNWVRDAVCQDIHQDFTLAFSQIPKNWSASIIPAGASFESIYKDF